MQDMRKPETALYEQPSPLEEQKNSSDIQCSKEDVSLTTQKPISRSVEAENKNFELQYDVTCSNADCEAGQALPVIKPQFIELKNDEINNSLFKEEFILQTSTTDFQDFTKEEQDDRDNAKINLDCPSQFVSVDYERNNHESNTNDRLTKAAGTDVDPLDIASSVKSDDRMMKVMQFISRKSRSHPTGESAREAMIALHKTGMPATEIAKIFSVNPATVRRWLKRYKTQNSLSDAPRTGRPKDGTLHRPEDNIGTQCMDNRNSDMSEKPD